jgi:hypothetical protein
MHQQLVEQSKELQAYLSRLQLAVLVLQLCLHLLLTGPQAQAACLLSLLQTQQQSPAQQVVTQQACHI